MLIAMKMILNKSCHVMICNKISLTLHYLVVSRNCQVDEDELCLLSEKDWDFSLELDSSKLVGHSSASQAAAVAVVDNSRQDLV